jgi:hypothetical protein
MGQVIDFIRYKKARNSNELVQIDGLRRQLAELETVLHTSGNYLLREQAAIEMSTVQMEIVERMHKLGIMR